MKFCVSATTVNTETKATVKTQPGGGGILFGYFDTGDVGGVEILSSESHGNQDDERRRVVRRRLLTQLLHVPQVN